MSSEEEIVKIQKIMVAAAVMVALSIGVGGFDTINTWYQLDIDYTAADSDGDTIASKNELKFSLEGFTVEYEDVNYYNYDGSTETDSESFDLDYGDQGIFEESEDAGANIQRGGYLITVLILFIIWKLQEMKSETSEEVREETITQIRNALKGAGALVVLVLLYYLSGAGLEDDFDSFFIGETDGDYYYSFFSMDCEAAWIDKPEFQWSGSSEFSYNDADCADYYSTVGEGEMDFSLKLGFFAFAGSLVPIYFSFNNINPQLVSFSVPSVPNIPAQGMAVNPNPFAENKPVVPRKVTVQRKKKTEYQEPDVSVMAIPEDEED